jgi:NADH:ubiquinone oxidoreductase subunit 5 (subunit L)/multisubunit Na+/H+ antiporter MnhA subunit
MNVLQGTFYYCKIDGFYTITDGDVYFKHMRKGTTEKKVRQEVRNLNSLLKSYQKQHAKEDWILLILICFVFPIVIPIVFICAIFKDRKFEKVFTPQDKKLEENFNLSMALTVMGVLITSFIILIANKYGNVTWQIISIKCALGCIGGLIHSINSYFESKNYKSEMRNIIKEISLIKRRKKYQEIIQNEMIAEEVNAKIKTCSFFTKMGFS